MMSHNVVDLRLDTKRSRRSEKAGHSKHEPSKKPPSLRERRRRFRIYAGIAIVIFTLIAIFAVHWISYRQALRIASVSVRGMRVQDPATVADFAKGDLAVPGTHYIASDNIFAYQKDRIRTDVLKEFPRLKSVRVGRGGIFSTTLIVNVDERNPYGTFCPTSASTSRCYIFDETGFVFTEVGNAKDVPSAPYVLYGGLANDPIAQTYLEGHLTGMMSLLTHMQASGFAPISVQIDSDQDFSVHLKNGYDVKATFGQDVEMLVDNLQLVAVSGSLRAQEAQLEYIDLRFGNRVYFKLKGKEAQEQPPAAQ